MAKYLGILTPEKKELILNIGLLYPSASGTVSVTVSVISDTDSAFDEYICGSTESDSVSHLFINGVRFSSLMDEDGSATLSTTVYPYIFTFRIDPESELFTDGRIDVEIKSGTATVDTFSISVSDSGVQELDDSSYEAQQIDTKLSSYMLLRTNPKLSGNIKLVVDSDYHLYLDTFKVSSKLNDRVYRKYPISSEGNYPFDVMTVFSSLPESELFKLPADSLNPHKFFNDYKSQYLTEYEYGAETNNDNLYSENMKILAPLHLGKNIPDFFCIFRYDGTYNSETYNSVDIDDNTKFTELLEDSKIVKIFDLRNYTTIGQYLNNYKEYIGEFLYGSCYMQFIEQDNEKYGDNYRQGNNSWRGIDISKGIITNKIETSYFANDVLTQSSAVQETFNNFIIEGYERNNVLYPYILNLEFMFNDDDTEEYSMHRYFGLYLSSNEFLTYDCIIKDNSQNNGVTHKLDENDNEINDTGILDSIFASKFADRLFFITTNNDAARIQNTDDVKSFINEYVCNNPDKQLCVVKAQEMEWHDGEESFITMTFDEPIKYGEHLRFIAKGIYNEFTKKEENVCLEIVASNDSRLLDTDNFISPYVNTNRPFVHNYEDSDKNNIYRLAFYSQSVTDESTAATLPEQFERIKACVHKFDSFIRFESANENTIGLTSSHDNVYFQHIAPVNMFDDPVFDKLYLVEDAGKYQLCFTGEESLNDNPDSYVAVLRDKMGDKCSTVKFVDRTHVTGNEFYIEDDSPENAASFVDYYSSDNVVDDTIHYFSKTYKSCMHPLCPESYYYLHDNVVFSTFGYDILGWRYNNIVKFKNISELKYTYTIFSDIEDVLKVSRHPLVKTVEGTFETFNKIAVSDGYITDNILYELNPDIGIYTQEIKSEARRYNVVTSPYNVDRTIIDFAIQPSLFNYGLSMYNPESAALCVMGIYGIKDIDMAINLDQTSTVSNNTSIEISAGEILYIESREDTRIVKNVLYSIESGSFNEFGGAKFMIVGDTLYYTNKERADGVYTAQLYNGTLTAASAVKLTVINSNTYQNFNFTKNIPTQHVENFFVDPTSTGSSNLNISIVPQTNCLWESNGQYYDGNPVLNVADMVTNVPYSATGYFTEHKYSPVMDSVSNMFSKNSIDSYVRLNNSLVSFRDLITDGTISNPIRKMIVLNKNIDTAIGYYNSYVQSLEFVYYGIKFTLKFNSEYYNQNIQIGEYNNFEIFIVNDYDITKDNEIYISVDEEIILFINHQFNMYGCVEKYNQIKQIETDLTGYASYGVQKAPYSIYSNSICGIGATMLGHKSTEKVIEEYSYTDGRWFVQESKPADTVRDNTAVLPNYFYFDYAYCKDYDKTLTVNQSTKENISILQYLNSKYDMTVYPPSFDEKNLLNVLHRTESSFVTSNISDSYIFAYDTDDIITRYIDSLSGDFVCYIISNSETESIKITDSYKPISISLSVPNQIKYNFGYFVPKVYDIVEFETNDYELGTALGMSMLLGNTKLSNVNRINSYSGNKIFNDSVSVAQNYFLLTNKSIFLSNWDCKYYRVYNSSSQNRFSYVNGYLPGIEDKAFFGSRCMTLKSQYIELTDFSSARASGGTIQYVNSSYNQNSKNTKQCTFTINITQCMYSLFQNNETFIANWDGFDTDIDTSMKNYIKNSISEIYNSNRSREVLLYSTPDNGVEKMQIDYAEPDDISSWTLITDGEYDAVPSEGDNNDILITFTMTELKNTIIHPVVKIYRY